MFHSRFDEGFPLGCASEFLPGDGHVKATASQDPFAQQSDRRTHSTAVYKTANYRSLEDQVRKRFLEARSVLDKAELTPQDSRATSRLANALSDADVALRQLDLEARGSPSGQALASEVASYAEKLQKLRQQSSVILSRVTMSEPTVAHLAAPDLESVNTRLINECNATALQTEGLGLHIMEHLRSQRDTILKTNRLAEATGAEGTRGRHTIVKMMRDHWINRTILTVTIVLLAVCILLVLAHKSKLFRFPD